MRNRIRSFDRNIFAYVVELGQDIFYMTFNSEIQSTFTATIYSNIKKKTDTKMKTVSYSLSKTETLYGNEGAAGNLYQQIFAIILEEFILYQDNNVGDCWSW